MHHHHHPVNVFEEPQQDGLFAVFSPGIVYNTIGTEQLRKDLLRVTRNLEMSSIWTQMLAKRLEVGRLQCGCVHFHPAQSRKFQQRALDWGRGLVCMMLCVSLGDADGT